MVLSDQLFHYFYDTVFPASTQLGNISGRADIMGTFTLENPLKSALVSGCQDPRLSTLIDIYDVIIEGGNRVKGRSIRGGQPSELVATKAFPNMPASFRGNENVKKYHEAYFTRRGGVWTHDDSVQRHPIIGNLVFLGRVDGVLNPSSVRFGSAEIYNVIERDIAQEVAESVFVG